MEEGKPVPNFKKIRLTFSSSKGERMLYETAETAMQSGLDIAQLIVLGGLLVTYIGVSIAQKHARRNYVNRLIAQAQRTRLAIEEAHCGERIQYKGI
jgi:hypothetical protein